MKRGLPPGAPIAPLVALASLPLADIEAAGPRLAGRPADLADLLPRTRLHGTEVAAAANLDRWVAHPTLAWCDSESLRKERIAIRHGAVAHLLGWEKGAREVIDRLTEAGHSPPLVLKGGAAKYRLYPEPHLRPSADLDLLLPADEVAGAAERLAAAGFSPLISDPARPWTALQGHHVGLARGKTVVELHRTVDYHDNPVLRYAALVPDAVPLSGLHPGALAPSDAGNAVVAAAHALKHGLHVPLRDLVDLQLWIQAPDGNVERGLELAKAAELDRALAWLARVCGLLFGRWTPAHDLLAAHLPLPAGAWLDPWQQGGCPLPDGPARRLAAHLLLTPGLRPSLRLVGRFAHRRIRDLSTALR